MNEVITAIQNFIQSNFDIKHIILMKTLIVTMANSIAILLTWCGVSMPTLLIKVSDWKNRKAIKGIVLKRINDDTFNNYIRKLFVEVVEIFLPIIGLVIINFFMCYALLFFQIRGRDIMPNEEACIILAILFGIMILNYILKKAYYKLGKTLYRNFMVAIGGTLGVIPIVLFINKKNYLLSYLAMMSIVILKLIIDVLNKKDFYKDYQNMIVRISRRIRHILGCGYIIYIFLNLKMFAGNIILFVWYALCITEYIVIYKNDDNQYVDITIKTMDGKKITNDKIIQYEGNKIKYKLKNGVEEIVNNNVIQNITYCQKHLLIKSKAGNKRGTCFFYTDNTDEICKLEFQNYRMDDTWAYFSTRNGRKKDVFIININEIKKIEILSSKKWRTNSAGKLL